MKTPISSRRGRKRKPVQKISAYSNGQQMLLDFGAEAVVEPESEMLQWPPNAKFPLNLPELGRSTQAQIIDDLRASADYLIVSGFSSLNHLIDFFGNERTWVDTRRVRLLLGWDPKGFRRRFWAAAEVGREVKDYWLGRGLWLDEGGAVFRFAHWLREGRIETRYTFHQHAKIYVGDRHAILGSANFSKQGTTTQQEANIRVRRPNKLRNEASQYEQVKQIGENFYALAHAYTPNLLDLLAHLFQVVGWPDALARAIAALLDDRWYEQLPALAQRLEEAGLWPSQQSGLIQALHLLQTHHCVLIADPTGSGKTRMTSAVMLALLYGLRAQGDQGVFKAVTVSPPTVQESWENEMTHLLVPGNGVSTGILSQQTKKLHRELARLRTARALVIDEAHNLLNPNSKRSRQVATHGADYVVLSTATPINKRVGDLLRILQLLDIDNLSDNHLRQYRQLYQRYQRGIDFRPSEKRQLKDFIGQFLLRRTKPYLRQLIAQDPDSYRNRKGELCAYPAPKHWACATEETTDDVAQAQLIDQLTDQLQGLLFLRQFKRPDVTLNLTPEKLVAQRVGAAPKLAKYLIQSRLRSSRFALLEHAVGTVAAADELGWRNCQVPHSGNVVASLTEFSTKLPYSELPDEAFILYPWLRNEEQYLAACNREINIYQRIVATTLGLSDSREQGKAKLLQQLLTRSTDHHGLVLAFDSIVGTLHYLHWKYLRQASPTIHSYVAAGGTGGDRLLQDMELGSKVEYTVALCSDAFSEGVNLQQASVVVFLNMPGVIRLAEQRIGRVERLDSPHQAIEIYWPDDHEAFALKTDKRLFRAAQDTAEMLGANFHPPTQLLHDLDQVQRLETIRAAQAIEELERLRTEEAQQWEGLPDAFQPVRELFEGSSSIISPARYEQMRGQKATVKVRMSWVPAEGLGSL